MSAAETLSIVANAFQVVGFADIVFRAGKAVFDLFDKARSASRDIGLLLFELKALLAVIALVRAVISEHASSPFTTEDNQTLPNIHTILTLINQDFSYLIKLIPQSGTTWSGSWFTLIQNSFRWALQDHDITAARGRLVQYSQNLNTALSAVGRRNDIVLRAKVQAIEERLKTVAIAQPSLQQVLAPSLPTQPKYIRPHIRIPRHHLKVHAAHTQPKNDNLDQARSTIPSQSDDEDTVAFEDLVYTYDEDYPKINIYQNGEGELIVDTGNDTLQEIAKPAIMLQESLSASLDSICADGTIINKAQVKQIQMLLDSITASALTAKAEAISNKHMFSRGDFSLESVVPTQANSEKKKQSRLNNAEGNELIRLQQQCLRVKSNVGMVSATVISARTFTDCETLAIHFQYHGHEALNLTPFSGDFISNALSSLLYPMTKVIRYGDFTDLLSRCWDQVLSGERDNGRTWFLHKKPSIVELFMPGASKPQRIDIADVYDTIRIF